MWPGDRPAEFPFDHFLGWLERYGHNFIRLWTWELLNWDTSGNSPAHRTTARSLTVALHPWARIGDGKALDGGARFDLERFDDAYFARLRSRVKQAGERGFYVSVMLFEGWGIRKSPGAWENHPFHPDNNVNGLPDADLNGDGLGIEIHTLAVPRVLAVQEAYVRKVIDTVNEFDHVLFEIINEGDPLTTSWQYRMIEFVRQYEKGKAKQHPVGMTYQQTGGLNSALFESPADWISPGSGGGYRANPPVADGGKVILTDTDHLWGVGGTEDWVWKSFLCGMNPIFMDPYDGVVLGLPFDVRWEPVRRAMGYTREFAEKMDLGKMVPRKDLSSTHYCLANPGNEYLVYFSGGGPATLDLSDLHGKAKFEWFVPATGVTYPPIYVECGDKLEVRPPFGGSAVLHVRAE